MSIATNLSPLTASLGSTLPRAVSRAAQPGSNAGSSSSANSVNSLGATFMSLLAQELQNQDPTQPMDSTEMVGQMISLNELDQVASINQLLSGALGSNAGAAGTESTSAAPSPVAH